MTLSSEELETLLCWFAFVPNVRDQDWELWRRLTDELLQIKAGVGRGWNDDASS